jgi:hypothetical protein
MAKDTLARRIETKTWKRGPRECWPWLGYINQDGEARIWVNDELGSVSVQKAYYIARDEEIPPGKEVMSCPILQDCANPDHHSLGNREEIADRILWRKGLKRRPARNKRQRLSDEQVKQIFLSDEEATVLAERYGVTQGQISNIRAGRVRRDVTEPIQHARPSQIKDGRSGELRDNAEFVGAGSSGR